MIETIRYFRYAYSRARRANVSETRNTEDDADVEQTVKILKLKIICLMMMMKCRYGC